MKVLVTGSSGHLGEALMRVMMKTDSSANNHNYEPVGLDLVQGEFTSLVGDITDRTFVSRAVEGVDAIVHTATLHKPHVETHSRQRFVDVNITGTLNLLEEAVRHGVKAFVFTSTTSLYGDAMKPPKKGDPAIYVTEAVQPRPKNIYGVTKVSAENLCQLMNRLHGLPCVVLRTSRFFPETDDQQRNRESFDDANLKTNEFLYRRVDLEDVVNAHLLAIQKANELHFDCSIISSTSPFTEEHLEDLGRDGESVVRRLFPDFQSIYATKGWKMIPTFDRVYSNRHARSRLGWEPKYDFRYHLDCLTREEDPRSPLATLVQAKGYHSGQTLDFTGVPFPAKQEEESL